MQHLSIRCPIVSTSSLLSKLEKPVVKKRGRSSLTTVQSDFEKKKRRRPTKPVPEQDIRRDQTGHMSTVMHKRQRCRRPGLKGQTVFKCIKCGVHLCLNKNSNCFVNNLT